MTPNFNTHLAGPLAANATVVNFGTTDELVVGDFLRIDEEPVQIAAISGREVTLTRSIFGATPIMHSLGADIRPLRLQDFRAPLPGSGGGGAVSSVAGRTGDVVLVKGDVGLGNVVNVASPGLATDNTYTGTQLLKKAADGASWISLRDQNNVELGLFYNSSGEGSSFFGVNKGLTIMSDTNPGYSTAHIDGGKSMTLFDVNNSNFSFIKSDSGFFTFNRKLYIDATVNADSWLDFSMAGYGSLGTFSPVSNEGGAYLLWQLGAPLVFAGAVLKLQGSSYASNDQNDGETIWMDDADGRTLKVSSSPA
jgi:hypothetical protein